MKLWAYSWYINWGRGCGSEHYHAMIEVSDEEYDRLVKLRDLANTDPDVSLNYCWEESEELHDSWERAHDKAVALARQYNIDDEDVLANIDSGVLEVIAQIC